ncbi:MAG: type II toxin-antitoxin system RelE/ParE family toxin [Gammaproteobacteria bacterium]|nr:MAG: type II toxin-antitoxin system RelE/ParE family toxin [Gammaproteobacteria bacterium]
MKYTLTVRRVAELDITEAFNHYESVRLGLGHDFLLCLEEALSKIERTPKQYQFMHKELRRCLVHRFPYVVLYFIEDSCIIVTAVLHARKNPSSWDERT